MDGYTFFLEKPVRMILTGKFEAPHSEWIHLSRELMDYELIVMAGGVLHLACDDREYSVRPGQFLLLPPYARQQGTEPSECRFYWLHFSPAAFGEAKDFLSLPRTGSLDNREKVIVLMGQLQDSVRRYNHRGLNDSLATAVLCEIFCQNSIGGGERHRQIIHDIIDFVRWHRKISLRVNDIAARFGYNPKYLTHLFAREYGQSLKQFIQEIVMDEAKVLLADSNMKISQIGYALGYEDSHHFMKAFRKNMGMTASEYREASSRRLLYYR